MGDWQNWGNAQVVAGEGTAGSNAMQVGPGAGGAGLIVQGIVAGTAYHLVAQVRDTNPSEPVNIGVKMLDASGNEVPSSSPYQFQTGPHAPTDWAPTTVDLVAPPNAVYALVWVWKVAGSSYGYVDDVAFGPTNASPPPPSSNLVANGGFEAGMASWVDWGNTQIVNDQVNSGTSALGVGTAAGGTGQMVDGIVAGTVYRFVAHAKVSDSSQPVYVGAQFLDAAGTVVGTSQLSTASTTYTTLSADATAAPGAVRALVYVWKNSSSGLAYVDDIVLGVAPDTQPPTQAGPNLVANPNFEGLAPWVNWGNTEIVGSSINGTEAQVGTAAGGFGQTVTGVVAGSTYRLNAQVKVSSPDETGYVGLKFLDSAGNSLQDGLVPFTSTSYSSAQVDVVAPASATNALVYVWKNAGSGYAYVHEVTLTQVAAPAPAPTSLIQPGPFAPFDEAALSSNFEYNARGLFSAARLTGGGSVVAWSTGSSILLQRLDVDGQALGAAQTAGTVVSRDFNVNTRVSVVATADGGWLVAWIAADRSVLFRRYDASGASIGAASPVDTTAFTSVLNVQARALANGDFVVAWTAAEGTGPTHAFVRRFSAAGVAVTDRVSVGNSAGSESDVQITPMPDGNFMAAWEQPNADGTYTVVARRLDAALNGAGAEQVLDAAAMRLAPGSFLGAASLSSGRVLIAWGYDPGFAPYVRWQVLDASGTPLLPIASPGSSDPVTGAILDSVEVIPAATGFRVLAESGNSSRFGELAVTTLVEVGAAGERLGSTNTTRTLAVVNRTEPTGCSGPIGNAPGVAAAGGEDGHYLLAYAVCPAPTVPATSQRTNLVVMGR